MAATSPDPYTLDPRGRAGGDRHVARRNADCAGDQAAMRPVGLAVGRRGAHARLEHGAPIGQALDSFERFASAARVSRTSTSAASAAAVTAPAHGRSVDVRQDVKLDDVANENDDQEQNHRRDVDAAEIRQKVPDRPQHRLGNAIEKFADHGDRLVARIHHMEGDQPRKDCGCDYDPDVKLKGKIDNEK
jgi:hypothetical protein